jgi:hypothetical protein
VQLKAHGRETPAGADRDVAALAGFTLHHLSTASFLQAGCLQCCCAEVPGTHLGAAWQHCCTYGHAKASCSLGACAVTCHSANAACQAVSHYSHVLCAGQAHFKHWCSS